MAERLTVEEAARVMVEAFGELKAPDLPNDTERAAWDAWIRLRFALDALQPRAEAEGAQQTSVYDPMDAIAANARRVANSVQRGQRETTSAPVVTTTQLGGGVAEEPPPPHRATREEIAKLALDTLEGDEPGSVVNPSAEALAEYMPLADALLALLAPDPGWRPRRDTLITKITDYALCDVEKCTLPHCGCNARASLAADAILALFPTPPAGEAG